MIISMLEVILFKKPHNLYKIRLLKKYMTAKMMSTESAPENKFLVEGQAKIRLTSDKVFYNPVQEFNRDMSVAVLRTFITDLKNQPPKKSNSKKNEELKNIDQGNNITILEALSATGLRSIRYAKEVPGVTKIIANDLSRSAVENIKSNIVLNDVQNIVDTNLDDATLLMYKYRRFPDRFMAVDLDPYGCPSMFLDSAVQCVQDGGLLLVTATDMAVLAGNSPETCYSKYGSISLKLKSCHEQGLRILLQCIESHANRYGRFIVPLLSMSADFYIRVFVKIYTGPAHCKKSLSKLSLVYQCVGCETFTLQALGELRPTPTEKDPERVKYALPRSPAVSQQCEHCGWEQIMGGPIWNGPLHDVSFVERVLSLVQSERESFVTSKRMEGALAMMAEELEDVPLYYTTEKLYSVVHLESIPIIILRSAIMNSGYRVSYSHACKTSVKTDAPAKVIWDILRTWEKTHPITMKRMEEDSPAKAILQKEISTNIDMTQREDANPSSRKGGFLRFQFNPQPHWGPGTRATVMTKEERISKCVRNQNKKSREKRERSESSEAVDGKHLKLEENLPS